MSVLSEEELNTEIEKGYVEVLNGRTKPVETVFADIYEDYKA